MQTHKKLQMLLINNYSAQRLNEFLKRLVRARTVGYLFLIAVRQSTHHLALQASVMGIWLFLQSCYQGALWLLIRVYYTNTLTYLLTLPYLSKELGTKTSDTLTSASKTDVTPATLSREFVARLYRAIKSQRATVQLHAATLSHKQIKQTWLITTFLLVV